MAIQVANCRGDIKGNGIKKDNSVKKEENIDVLVEKKDIKPIESFKDKDSLEEYGLTFGINLNKTKKLENMYNDLLEFIK